MPRLLTAMCFDLDSPDGKILAEVIARGVGFELTSFRADAFRRGGGRFSAKAHLPKLAAGKDVTHLALEVETGAFDHGGVRLIRTWLDAKGDSIRRSRAVMCELQELGEGGELLWSERRDVQGR